MVVAALLFVLGTGRAIALAPIVGARGEATEATELGGAAEGTSAVDLCAGALSTGNGRAPLADVAIALGSGRTGEAVGPVALTARTIHATSATIASGTPMRTKRIELVVVVGSRLGTLSREMRAAGGVDGSMLSRSASACAGATSWSEAVSRARCSAASAAK